MVAWENKTAYGTADMGRALDLLHQKNGWNANNSLQQQQSNHVSKKQCFLHMRQQQLKTKTNCNAAGTARQINCGNDSHKQGKHGCNDGENKCTHVRWRRKTTNPPGQGEYPHLREQSPHIKGIRNKPAQKTQEAQVHMSPLQNVCPLQT